MSDFILQANATGYEQEMSIVKSVLTSCPFNNYTEATIKNLKAKKNATPIGTINFVRKYANLVYGPSSYPPLEVPDCLRTDKYLHRFYCETTRPKELINQKSFTDEIIMIKPVDFIKQGLNNRIFLSDMDKYLEENPNVKRWVLQEHVNIVSEWRVYTRNSDIVNVSNYNGDPSIFPNINIVKEVLAKLVLDYLNKNMNYSAFAIDFAITDKSETIILEAHDFVACGLYSSVWGCELLDMYKIGWHNLCS